MTELHDSEWRFHLSWCFINRIRDTNRKVSSKVGQRNENDFFNAHFFCYHTPESYHSGLHRFALSNLLSNTRARKLWTVSQIRPTTCFCKLSFIGTQPYPFIYVLSRVGFVLQWQSSVWHTKLKIFTIWKKCADLQ